MKILEEVVRGIRPSKDEEKAVAEAANGIIKAINSGIKGADAILGGSATKGTWLSGTFDIDIFVRFDYKKFADSNDKLSGILKNFLKKRFRISTIHGSRDYFQIKKGRFVFEIVPVLKIRSASQAKNIMDISPLHAVWVKKRMSRKMCDEVRLTKAFCRAQGVYGAESYVKGFSGYACEILTIHYGSFIKLARAASKWNVQHVIDPEGYFKRKDVFMELNRSKLQSPLILVDPVQKERNITAALSKEKFDVFVNAAKQFIKRPSASFFRKEAFSVERLMKKAAGNRLVVVEAFPKKAKEDVMGASLLKAFEFISRALRKNDFDVKAAGWDWVKRKQACFWFITEKVLPEKKLIAGPPLWNERHVKRFRGKYKRIIKKKGRAYAEIKRRYREPEKLVKNLFKDSYIRERTRGIRICR